MKITIRKRLILSFGVIILISLFFGLYSIASLKNVKDKSSEITDVWLYGIDLAHTMDTANSDYRIREYRHIVTEDEKLMAETERELKDLRSSFEKALKDYEDSSVLQQERDLTAKIRIEYEKYIEVSNRGLQLSRDRKTKEAVALLYGESKERFEALGSDIGKLVELCRSEADKANAVNKAAYNRARLILPIILLAVVTAGVVIAIYMSNRITKPMKLMTTYLDKTADFDLVYDGEALKEINKYKDEFGVMGMAVANMRKSLRELVDKVKENSLKVSTNSDDLSIVIGETSQSIEGVAKAVEELAQGASELARNAQKGSEKLDALSGEINEAVNSSDLINKYVQETSKANSEGVDYIERLKEAVNTNNEVVKTVASQVDSLDDKSQSIGMITDTIKTITEQINLLSLNAAIEAARAGEQGKGFAVVAEEIRKLAYETANSAKEIDAIVRDVENEILSTKSEMTKAEMAVRQTDKVSAGTERAFEAIDNSVSNIIKQIDGLVNNIGSIGKNKNEVVASIGDISAIAEQSASLEQISVAAKDLKKISIELQELIGKFRT